ncbi:uncharacterized protein LOC123534247 isoform X2 [Mercenaria mercenaria]|nr:uncharacterized protein LOC123534247 isoform X2 [Mercenaria mercenaria]XP_045172350.2 uncharacterized protein LOC123534247 isoform X2 [Mercenaria mercenaria]
MNFYSQISRDETGAPKKWKMSSTLHIDEDSIKSKKAGTSKGSSGGSNKGTPTSSRENSNERKSRLNQSLQKGGRKSSLNRDGSSSEQSSSRESSLESKAKGDDKKFKKSDTDKKNRSISSDYNKPRKSLDSGSSASSDTGKKKRGRRPKSLDLSPKEMANGDDDNFKSPDPLTPCNIAIKRKKGRPKETPPVLYAEPPVESSPVENVTDYETEDSSPPLKRKPGRPKKIKKFKTDQLKSLGKGEKLKSFNMKRYEGRCLKQYSSKIIKSNMPKGFRRMNKLPKLTPVMTTNENSKNDGSMSSFENDEQETNKANVKLNGIPSEKRGPGRPPGAKNKKYYAPLTMLKTRAKAVKTIVSRNRTQFGSQSLKKAISRGPGRPPGARNKTTLQRLANKAIADQVIADKVETISNSSKENSVVAEKEEIPVAIEKEIESKMEVNAIDEAIEAVVFKARNDISLESNIKPRVPFRTTGFYKKLSSVKSVAKIKKEKDIMHKIRKKRILESQASGLEFTNQTEPLASNDLRRKLQSKLIQKMNAGGIQTSTKTEVVSKEEGAQKTEVSVKDGAFTASEVSKSDTLPNLSNINSKATVKNSEVNGSIPPASIEEKTMIKPETDGSSDNAKNVRRPNVDVAKFSDTESVCSELSTNSIGSLKRNIEKQVLILGEENIDSDDQTVRTRQRFEIIPGKKRKRTLSGEFDLLDEKQLRKERKKAEKGQTDDESDISQVVTVTPIKKPLFKRKRSPNKKSPNLKVKDGKIVKKYVSQLTAYRNRMLKQSPFLSRVRKKRRKPLMKRTPEKVSIENVTKSTGGTSKTVSTIENDKCNQEKQRRQIEQTEEKVVKCPEPIYTGKSENYRQGLFEKFTDVTLESKDDSVKENVDVFSEKNGDDADSDDTECTIELKDEILTEDHEEIPVEESVDDSDTIDFHAEVESESTGKELYTESEIEIREMLFELIDDIVIKFESKKDSQSEITDLKCGDEKVEAKSVGENVVAQTLSDREEINYSQKIAEEKCEELKEEKTGKEIVEDKPCDEEKKVEASEEIILNSKETKEVSDEHTTLTETEKSLKVVTDEEVAIDKDNNINKELDNPVTDDKDLTTEIEGESKNDKKAKIKHKIRRKRFVPLSLSKKKQGKIVTDTKVRKKPGRKPKQKSVDDLALNSGTSTETLNDKKVSSAESKSPETGVTRKFELRQKISRSPLDNIALKQSLEENEYLRNEAQKLSRKEAKFKLKSKTQGPDSLESSPIQSKEIETTENAVIETQAQPVVESVIETEEKIETVEDLLKCCKPCKIVLKDFIKELERAQGQTESSCESEGDMQDSQDNSDEEKGSIPAKHHEAVEINADIAQPNESQPLDVAEGPLDKISTDNTDKDPDKPEMPNNVETIDDTSVNNEKCVVKESTELDQIKTVDNSESPKQNEITENMGEINDNDKKVTETVSPDIKQRELRPKRRTPVKNENISPLKSAVTPPKKVRNIKSINEQQTARKTVPPLKIKVKGGFSSKRKTYIVEPSPDSPVEQSSKGEQKMEKKKEKSKTKSGNKSESSDSEKHSKSHHHHRKKNKTPTEDLIIEQNKAFQMPDTSTSFNSVLPEKPAIKATDAYEATFLQFIQDKDKVEQNMAAFSSSFGSKPKSSSQSIQKVLQKESKFTNASFASTSSSSVNSMKAGPKSISSDLKVSPASVLSDTPNDVDNSEVQYVCSQCDNVVYKAKEHIIQHYREVHPGSQFIYKPLPETAENVTATAEDPCPKTAQREQKMDDSVVENNLSQTSTEETEQTNEDEDSGSLNLKIVDVVSLKDQETILNSDSNVSKEEQVAPVHTVQTNQIQTQLRIPSYPILTSAPPPYPVNCSIPPPPYSIATASAISAIQEQLQFKAQSAPLKQKSQIPSGKIGNSFKCEKCNVHAPMLAAMVAHLRNSHREIPRLFQCPYCKDMEAETEALIHQHIKKHHPTNNPNPPVALSEPAKRNLKTLSVKLPEGLKLGEGNSIEKDIYMCLKCKEHMPSLETIYEHLEHEHAEIFAYVCPVCKVFKSKSEELVNNHIVMNHHRRPAEVNVSLAIDGNHFVRVQCLVKDKAKSGQKSVHSVQQKQQLSPSMNAIQQSKPAVQVPGQITTSLHLQPIPQVVVPQESPVSAQGSSNTNPLNPLQQTSSNIQTPSVGSKPTVPGQKKKKSLLESIQKIKVQKMEQQGLLPQKSATSVTSTIPSHPSQLGSAKPNTAPGAAPPPLMRGPPPLIRYDQLSKVTSPQSIMLGSAIRTSSQLALQNQASLTSLQRLQNITSSQNAQSLTGTARPIQSSLFDTSDLESVKSQQSQRPVLNVPVVSRVSNKSPFSKVQSTSSTPEIIETTATGSPLDLSKTTPSPVPQSALPLNSGQVQVSGAGLNPEVFQVFNLRPSTQMQLPRQQIPVPQMIAQPIMLPQQVRQNTPSTLAYRPAGSQMIATSQVQQLIGMPVGTAVIGNMVVSLGNVSQGIPAMPVVNPALQNAQFVRMSAPQIPAVTMLNSSENSAVSTQAQSKSSVTGQPGLSKATLFRCPYCPNITPLRFDQVQTHIENKHPGSSVLFKPFETR